MIPALTALQEGKLIAYPTEAVFGLGCDPFNEVAVNKLLALKHRPVEKGLILIASQWNHIQNLMAPLSEDVIQTLQNNWPGPITYLVPASDKAPKWITGAHSNIALRITDHPVAKALCDTWNGPLVSTSANPSEQPPATTQQVVEQYFGDAVELIVPGDVGNLMTPTEIIDVSTGRKLR